MAGKPESSAPRDEWVQVRVNAAEKLTFQAAACRAGKRGVGAWLRSLAVAAAGGAAAGGSEAPVASITDAEREDIRELARQLARVGQLLNQQVHRLHIIHETGEGLRPTAEEVRGLQGQVAELAAKVRDLLGAVGRRRIRARKAARAVAGEHAATL